MKITFTRNGKRTYTTLVERDDGVMIQVPSHDRPSSLPHDIAHYVVEQELRLERGFWGRVASGAMFGGMRVVSGRLPPHAASRSKSIIKEEEQQLIEAEVLVGLLLNITHQRLENDWTAVQSHLNSTWKPRKPSRESLSHQEVLRVCGELRKAEQRWEDLPVSESITVSWKPQHNKSLDRTWR